MKRIRNIIKDFLVGLPIIALGVLLVSGFAYLATMHQLILIHIFTIIAIITLVTILTFMAIEVGKSVRNKLRIVKK